jgi:vacuolar-type H+-ATPase subunit H
MQEIVTKVLEAEKAAEQGIQEVRSKAGEIRAQADREVHGTMQQAREQAGKRSQEILEAARSRAQEEYDKAVQQIRDENQAFFKNHEKEISRAVEAVIQGITAPEWT